MTYVDLLFFLGRLLFGGYFLAASVRHLITQKTQMVGYAKSRNVPMPDVAVPATGILLLAGGLGIIFWAYAFWAIIALLLFLFPVSFMMHSYWKDGDPAVKAANRVNFWKNMALAGALLMFLSLA